MTALHSSTTHAHQSLPGPPAPSPTEAPADHLTQVMHISPIFAREIMRDQYTETVRTDTHRTQPTGDMTPPPPPPAPPAPSSSQRSSRSSKRNSGIFDHGFHARQEQAQKVTVLRRTSKRASSQDRHGQIYGDPTPSFRPETPEMMLDTPEGQTSPLPDRPVGASPRRNDPTRYELPASSHPPAIRESPDPSMLSRDNGPRPRTRTMEERIRSRSPQTNRGDPRKRIGSVQSVSHLPLQEDLAPSGNMLFSPIPNSSSQASVASSSRPRVPPLPHRPVSPSTLTSQSVSTSNLSTASTARAPSATGPELSAPPNPAETEEERIMRLMKATAGRASGILKFRFTRNPVWQSGFCAIKPGVGNLIYQPRGELAQPKVLIADLRACTVRTQSDPESGVPFLEMSMKASGFCIYLRPDIPETFDYWLAALLCWQPLKQSGARNSGVLPRRRHWRSLASEPPSDDAVPASEMVERAPSRAALRTPQDLADVYAEMRKSPTLKTTRILWWDSAAPQSAVAAPPRRVSTYKQQRMAAGAPWRKAIASVKENGLFEVFLESTKENEINELSETVAATVDLGNLRRYAVQKLHPSVLDDEFSLAVFTQYQVEDRSSLLAPETEDGDAVPTSSPVYLSFETRILFEAWYAMFRALTVPELYGPHVNAPEVILHPTSDAMANAVVPEDTFRVKRSMFLRITEAHLHAPRQLPQDTAQFGARDGCTVGNYHAEVHIDGDVRGRTSIQNDTSNPFWRSDYEFNHLPPFASTVTIQVKARQEGQCDYALVSDNSYTPEETREVDHLDMIEHIHISPLDSLHGTVEINLDEMDRGTDTEQWWNVLNEFGEQTGRLLLRIRIDETVILAADEYADLKKLLHAFSNSVATDIVDKCTDTASYITETLLNIFQVSNSASRWISTMVEDEIDSLQRDVSASKYRFSRRIASNDSYDSGVEREIVLRNLDKSANATASLLFRGNTPLTKALEFHMRRLGKEYLEDVLGERLRDIDESEPECEVDPNRVQDPVARQRNWRNLQLLTESIWRSIRHSANACPAEIRQILRTIRACSEDKYGDFLRTIAYSSVSAFLFLRFLVPAILSPSLFGLLKETPRLKARRTLTLIAKSLQSLANLSSFGNKEPWMEPMNVFLTGHRQEFKDFIDDITSISQERVSQPPPAPRDFIAPIRVHNQLPAAAKEGFPSLPYLIDQPREYAILVNAWMDNRKKSDAVVAVSEDLARLDVLCSRLRDRTRQVLQLTVEQTSSGDARADCERLLQQLDIRGQISRSSSRITSPVASPKPSQDEMVPGRISAQGNRPQPIRTSSSQTAPIYRSHVPEDLNPPPISGGSLEGLAAARAANAVLSPTNISIAGSHIEEADEYSRPGSVGEDEDFEIRDRITSIGSGATGYIHPLAWNDQGSTGGMHSKANSLQDIDMHAANTSSQGYESGALPLPDGGEHLATEFSPMTSPRDPNNTNRFFDKLTGFGRRVQQKNTEKTDKERRDEEEAKKKKKEKKKERGKERTREGSFLMDGGDIRLGHF